MVMGGAVTIAASGASACFVGAAFRVVSGYLPFRGARHAGYRRDLGREMTAEALLGSSESRSRRGRSRVAAAPRKKHHQKKIQKDHNEALNFHTRAPPSICCSFYTISL